MSYLDRGIIYVVSDILSLITILACVVLKVPQIKIIQETKSAAGNYILFVYTSFI